MVISEDPWHSHLLPSIWQSSCHYLFLRLRSVATGDRTPTPACEANALSLLLLGGSGKMVENFYLYVPCNNRYASNSDFRINLTRVANSKIAAIWLRKVFLNISIKQFWRGLTRLWELVSNPFVFIYTIKYVQFNS